MLKVYFFLNSLGCTLIKEDVEGESRGLLILQENAFKITVSQVTRRKKTTGHQHFSSEKIRAGQGGEISV